MSTAFFGERFYKYQSKVNLVTKYAFDILNVNRVTLNVFEVNPGAKKCYESVGFEVEARKNAMLKYNDEEWDAYFMVKNK